MFEKIIVVDNLHGKVATDTWRIDGDLGANNDAFFNPSALIGTARTFQESVYRSIRKGMAALLERYNEQNRLSNKLGNIAKIRE